PENISEMIPWSGSWPENIWLGFTGEDQLHFESRYKAVRQFAGRVSLLFLSAEPLLGPIEFTMALRHIDWVILGWESGTGGLAFDIDWARSLLGQCRQSGVPAFMKQVGSKPVDHDKAGNVVALRLRDWKGGDCTEWPPELRWREFPSSTVGSK